MSKSILNNITTENSTVNRDCAQECAVINTVLCCADASEMPKTPDGKSLPSAKEYAARDQDYQKNYFDWSIRKWSEPKYICPKCKEGGMCRDETMILTSIPPKHQYECNKCHHVEYHSI